MAKLLSRDDEQVLANYRRPRAAWKPERAALVDTLRELGAEQTQDGYLDELVELACGLDARQLRKLVLEGIIRRRDLVDRPKQVSWRDRIAVLQERSAGDKIARLGASYLI